MTRKRDAMSAPVVSAVDFDSDVLESDVPVLVDFTAVWCPPCKALSPVVDAVASEFAGRARVVKVDIEESPAVTSLDGIQSIPALVIFVSGEPVERLPSSRYTQQSIGSAIAKYL